LQNLQQPFFVIAGQARNDGVRATAKFAEAKAPSGNTLSDAGDSAVRVPRSRKVFPEVGAKPTGLSSRKNEPVSDTNQMVLKNYSKIVLKI